MKNDNLLELELSTDKSFDQNNVLNINGFISIYLNTALEKERFKIQQDLDLRLIVKIF